MKQLASVRPILGPSLSHVPAFTYIIIIMMIMSLLARSQWKSLACRRVATRFPACFPPGPSRNENSLPLGLARLLHELGNSGTQRWFWCKGAFTLNPEAWMRMKGGWWRNESCYWLVSVCLHSFVLICVCSGLFKCGCVFRWVAEVHK